MNCTIYIDGGARGNPGPAGAGVVIRDDDRGQVIHEAGYFLGANTNNVAEYQSLLKALELAHELIPNSVHLYSDSELLVRQIIGQYRVKAPGLKPLHDRARALFGRLAEARIEHIPREENSRADALANKAIDACRDVLVLDMHGPPSADAAIDNRAPAAHPQDQPLCWVAQLAGARSRCQLGQGTGGEYAFGPTTPEGFCVWAASAVLSSAGPLHWDPGRTTGELRCPRCAQRITLQRADAPAQ